MWLNKFKNDFLSAYGLLLQELKAVQANEKYKEVKSWKENLLFDKTL